MSGSSQHRRLQKAASNQRARAARASLAQETIELDDVASEPLGDDINSVLTLKDGEKTVFQRLPPPSVSTSARRNADAAEAVELIEGLFDQAKEEDIDRAFGSIALNLALWRLTGSSATYGFTDAHQDLGLLIELDRREQGFENAREASAEDLDGLLGLTTPTWR